MQEIVKLQRDVNVVLVPYGNTVVLPQGAEVTITQDLGGTYTITIFGSMYRLENKDADALGKNILDFSIQNDLNLTLEDRIWNVMRACYDPEIPVNIVDLGLIYGVTITDSNKVVVRMTFTSPGCSMGPIIIEDVRQKVLALLGVNEVEVELVFDPPWDREMVSDQAKLELGLL